VKIRYVTLIVAGNGLIAGLNSFFSAPSFSAACIFVTGINLGFYIEGYFKDKMAEISKARKPPGPPNPPRANWQQPSGKVGGA
jgi:hypothetical protein